MSPIAVHILRRRVQILLYVITDKALNLRSISCRALINGALMFCGVTNVSVVLCTSINLPPRASAEVLATSQSSANEGFDSIAVPIPIRSSLVMDCKDEETIDFAQLEWSALSFIYD